MNYYEHHIGDYAEATAHLSFVEDAAYARLIRKYYATERPLPSDVKQAQRLVGARTREEKVAVETILQEFFVLEGDGWHNTRCDAEIAKYLDKKPAADEKKENDKERQKRARERRKLMFEQLSSHGINMPWNATMETLHAELSRVTNRDESQTVTQPVTRDNTATQAPDTRHQTPNPKAAASELEPESRDPNPDAAAATGGDPITGRAIELAAMLRKRGAALQASDPRVREWAESGVTDAQALTALDIAEQRRTEQASPQPINAGLLNAILRNPPPGKPPPNGYQRPPNLTETRAATIAALTGKAPPRPTHERTERDITAEAKRLA